MSGALDSRLTFTRGSTAWYFNSSGNLTSASTNVPRFDYRTPGSTTLAGLLFESTATNRVLWDRDFTQSNWVKVNMTTALDQTGIDGSANTASSLTSTAANATALQTITVTAATRRFSIYIKRITGTGNVQIAPDGVTWTTEPVTSSWTRFDEAASGLNPAVGVRLVTSGDAVAVDVAQLEDNGFASSPILTTTATVSRSADSAVLNTSPWFTSASGSFFVQALKTFYPSNFNTEMEFDDNTDTNRLAITGWNSSTQETEFVSPSGGSGTTGLVNITYGTVYKMAATYSGNNFTQVLNGGGANTITFGTHPTGISRLRFGTDHDATVPCWCWIQRAAYWKYVLTTAQMQSVTQ